MITYTFLSCVVVAPTIDANTSTHSNLSVIAGQPVAIDCPASGVPPPVITWFKDNAKIKPTSSNDVRILYNGRRLEISGAEVSDAGRYRCLSENVAGSAEKNYDLHVLGDDDDQNNNINNNNKNTNNSNSIRRAMIIASDDTNENDDNDNNNKDNNNANDTDKKDSDNINDNDTKAK